MAYKQTPGRGNGMKTGSGISSALLQKNTAIEKAKSLEDSAKKAVKSYASNKKLTGLDLGIETAAASDSISARIKAGDRPKRELAKIGNKAANETRKANDSKFTVKKTQVEGKKGFEDKYTKTPVKQMSKLKSGKSPAKQVSKMPTAKAGSSRDKRPVDTMEKGGGRTLERNGTKEMPKANKKAPMKMKKC